MRFVRNILAIAALGVSAAAPAAEADARAEPPRLADVDPTNDHVVAPPAWIEDCEGRLARAGVRFRRAELPVRKRGSGPVCGAEQAVIYERGPRGIRYNSRPLVSCGMALALAQFEDVLTEESLRAFGKRVVRIEQGGTYSCRKMARFGDLVSEHSYANAIDIRSFRLENGRTISVLRHYGAAPGRPEREFLHRLTNRLYDEAVFSVVLTEKFDALHRDHFHLDLARYRVDGTR